MVADCLPDVRRETVFSALNGLIKHAMLSAEEEKNAKGGYRYVYTAATVFVKDYDKNVLKRLTTDLVRQMFADSTGVLRVIDVRRLLLWAFDFKMKRFAVLLAIQWLFDRGELVVVPGHRMAAYQLASAPAAPWVVLDRALRAMAVQPFRSDVP
jgi:hypothetical protein